MFLERLGAISKRIKGVLALSLVDKDGIPIESVCSDPDLDLEILAAEMVDQVRAMKEDFRELRPGPFRHFALATDQMTLMVSLVVRDYYLLLVLAPGANRARARFELRRARLALEEDLY